MKSFRFTSKHAAILSLAVAAAISIRCCCSNSMRWTEATPDRFVKELAEDYRIKLPPASKGLVTYHAAVHDVREEFVVLKVDGPTDSILQVEAMLEPERKFRLPTQDMTTAIQLIRVSDNIQWMPRETNIKGRLYSLKPLGEEVFRMTSFVLPGDERSSIIFYFSHMEDSSSTKKTPSPEEAKPHASRNAKAGGE
ncbi:hypothetical protein [Prosthecobacter sp.]|uniref:hypothetical protein n=1 Tax=Prosthecobacter sp. TaxID=1965333 RepID=UPI0037838184